MTFAVAPFANSAFADSGDDLIAVFSVTGVGATGAVGSVNVKADTSSNIVSGFELTGSLGAVNASAQFIAVVTGQSVFVNEGTLISSGGAASGVTAVASTLAVGDETVTGTANVLVTSASATGSVGSVTAPAAVTLTGPPATGALGSPVVSGTVDISLTSVSATSSLGTVTPFAGSNITLSGFDLLSSIGSASIVGDAVVYPTGVSGQTFFARATVWGRIVPNPNTTWTNVAA